MLERDFLSDAWLYKAIIWVGLFYGKVVFLTFCLFHACVCVCVHSPRRSASATPSNSPQSSQQSVYESGQQCGATNLVTTSAQSLATSSAPSLSAPSAPTAAASLSAQDQPPWNPFGDDNFSDLTAEELLNKTFTKLPKGNKCH